MCLALNDIAHRITLGKLDCYRGRPMSHAGSSSHLLSPHFKSRDLARLWIRMALYRQESNLEHKVIPSWYVRRRPSWYKQLLPFVNLPDTHFRLSSALMVVSPCLISFGFRNSTIQTPPFNASTEPPSLDSRENQVIKFF